MICGGGPRMRRDPVPATPWGRAVLTRATSALARAGGGPGRRGAPRPDPPQAGQEGYLTTILPVMYGWIEQK